MFYKRISILMVAATLLLTTGCMNPCGSRFPMMRRVSARIRMRQGWCPPACGQCIESAAAPLACGGSCGTSFAAPQPTFVGAFPSAPSCCGAPTSMEMGPILSAPTIPPITTNGADRLVPQPTPPQVEDQAQPRAYVPQ